MGRLGIEVWCYNWMAVVPWSRTSTALPTRGGATATGFDVATWDDAPDAPEAPVAEERLWETLAVPRAGRPGGGGGGRAARAPPRRPAALAAPRDRADRPPLDAYDRVFELQPSPVNGMTMCQGNVALMTDDLPAAIRRFGTAGRIHFVHFDATSGTPERFVETFVDDGPTDMAACIRAYLESGSTRRSGPITRPR